MRHISSSIKDVLAAGELAEGLAGWRAVEVWAEVVGEQVAGRSQAVRFDDGTLYVEVTNSAWVQELSFLRPRIVRQINQALGRDVVRTIHFALAGRRRGHGRGQ